MNRRYRPIALFVDATTSRLGGGITVVQRWLSLLRQLFNGCHAKSRDVKTTLRAWSLTEPAALHK
jgi:hypothetical protein